MNALHPFREGNGRAQREFIGHLAQRNGYYVAWENVKRDEVLKASIASFKGDTAQLAAIIGKNLFPLDTETPTNLKKRPSESSPATVRNSRLPLPRSVPVSWFIMENRFSQSELEAIAAALGDTSAGLTGSEIGHILATLNIADPTPDMTKWKRLHNAFVERQNYSRNRRAIMEFIRQAVKPERYAKCPERFEPMRANVNRALAFSALAVNAAGKIYAVDRADTLSEAQRRADELRADLGTRGVHPDVLRFCRAELVSGNYFHVVLRTARNWLTLRFAAQRHGWRSTI